MQNSFKSKVFYYIVLLWKIVDKTYNNVFNFLYKDWFNETFEDCIMHIVQYDIQRMKRNIIHNINWFDILMVYCKIRPVESYRLYYFNGFNPQSIYEITCWDETKYLTKYPFNAQEKSSPKVRTTILTAILTNKDVTQFINNRSASFNMLEKFTVIELIMIVFLAGEITYKELIDLVGKSSTTNTPPELFTLIDDENLSEQVYKDIVIIN